MQNISHCITISSEPAFVFFIIRRFYVSFFLSYVSFFFFIAALVVMFFIVCKLLFEPHKMLNWKRSVQVLFVKLMNDQCNMADGGSVALNLILAI